MKALTFNHWIFRILLPIVLMLQLNACAVAEPGVVAQTLTEVSFADTLDGMVRAASGARGTFLYMKDDLVLMGWNTSVDRFAFVTLSKSGNPVRDLAFAAGGKGQETHFKSMLELIEGLLAKGWIRATPALLPAEFKLILQSAGSLLAFGSFNLTTVFVAPAGMIQDKPWQPDVVQE
jgi:hypothetical protein